MLYLLGLVLTVVPRRRSLKLKTANSFQKRTRSWDFFSVMKKSVLVVSDYH